MKKIRIMKDPLFIHDVEKLRSDTNEEIKRLQSLLLLLDNFSQKVGELDDIVSEISNIIENKVEDADLRELKQTVEECERTEPPKKKGRSKK